MAAKQRDPLREQFWRDTIATWRASGLTVRDYCRRHELAETSFHHWQRVLRQRDAKPASQPAMPTFLPVTVIPGATFRVEVHCPSGHVVSLPNADATTLRQLFAALAPVPPC